MKLSVLYGLLELFEVNLPAITTHTVLKFTSFDDPIPYFITFGNIVVILKCFIFLERNVKLLVSFHYSESVIFIHLIEDPAHIFLGKLTHG